MNIRILNHLIVTFIFFSGCGNQPDINRINYSDSSDERGQKFGGSHSGDIHVGNAADVDSQSDEKQDNRKVILNKNSNGDDTTAPPSPQNPDTTIESPVESTEDSPVQSLDEPPADSMSEVPSENGKEASNDNKKWMEASIGNPSLQGSIQESGNQVAVVGGGVDIWGRKDQFHFAYQELTGDIVFQAQVISQENTNDFAKAALMLRTTLDQNSKHASLARIGRGALQTFSRADNGGTTSLNKRVEHSAVPVWLQIIRSGSQLTMSYSEAGSEWILVSEINMDLGDDILVGLAVTSQNATEVSRVQFVNVTTSRPGDLTTPPDKTTPDVDTPENPPVETTPPDVNGAELYATLCSSCHKPLNNSTKKGRSALEIFDAINDVPSMDLLKSLSSIETEAIAQALDDNTVECGDNLNIDTRVWRLTKPQYTNSINDLFSSIDVPELEHLEDASLGGVKNFSDTLNVSSLLAYQYHKNAVEISKIVANSPNAITGCNSENESCIEKFIVQFGERIFRQPVAADQQSRLMSIYRIGRQTNAGNGVKLIVQALLQSPYFIYRSELGESGLIGRVKLTPYEMATQLAYSLWNTTPDNSLLTKARNGQLQTPDSIQNTVDEMLANSKAKSHPSNFFMTLLETEKVLKASKSSAYPEFTTSLKQALHNETKMFIEEVFWNDGARLDTLLTAQYSFLNQESAKLYNVSGVSGNQLRKVSFKDGNRSGLLTHSSLLSVLAHEDSTGPIKRGRFVREVLLCQPLPSPPEAIADSIEVPAKNPNLTTRERFAEHSSNAACRSCHELVDPIGFGFENYDTIGRFRNLENNLPIDSAGEIIKAGDANSTFTNTTDLGIILSESDVVKDCVSKRYFMHMHGTVEPDANSCSQRTNQERFKSTNGNLRELVKSATNSDEFLYRNSK